MNPAPFELREPEHGEAPVVVEVPHAGLYVPAEVISNLVAPARALARDADLFVDELYEDATAEGASMLVAHTSRYAVDLNRAEDAVDAGVVVGDPRAARPHARGLLWRTTTDDEPALDRPLTQEEYRWRVDTIHRPYHDVLRAVLDRKIARFGYVILLAAHSMPSVGRQGHSDAGVHRADEIEIVVVPAALVDAIERHLERHLELGLSRNDGVVYLTIGKETVEGTLETVKLEPPV